VGEENLGRNWLTPSLPAKIVVNWCMRVCLCVYFDSNAYVNAYIT